MNAAITGFIRIVQGIQRVVYAAPMTLIGTYRAIQRILMILSEGMDQLGRGLSTTRLGRTTPVRLVVRVIQDLGDDDATHMAASVSYYAILSLFPLVVGPDRHRREP